MELSVIIPTHARPAKLEACARGLAGQTLAPARFEVLIGVDGEPSGERERVARVLPEARVLEFEHAGAATTRNRLLDHARGQIVLFLNDDVVPRAECLDEHVRAHEALAARGERTMILGAAPWAIREPDRLFDRLIRETSMIFFYDKMVGEAASDPGHDWGFRHAWTLNLSVHADETRAVGNFDESLPCACYEDLEWAWRLSRRRGRPVLYRPSAIVDHDHRYEPSGYLQREFVLGREAYRLARAAPECARDLFPRDITAEDELRSVQEGVERERPMIERMEGSFRELAALPSDAIAGEHGDLLIRMLYEHHLPVKRWWWRRGLLVGAEADSPRTPAPVRLPA